MGLDFDDLYEDEKRRLAVAFGKLEGFEFGPGSETDKRVFEMAAHTELGEAGFRIAILWEDLVKRTPLGDMPTGIIQPAIQIIERVKPETEADHDKHRHEIVTGQVDGVAGYIREDGSRHTDPIKKIIT